LKKLEKTLSLKGLSAKEKKIAVINAQRASVPGFKFRGYESEESDEEILPVSTKRGAMAGANKGSGRRKQSPKKAKAAGKKAAGDVEESAGSAQEADDDSEDGESEPEVAVKVTVAKRSQEPKAKPRKKVARRTRAVPRIRRSKS